MAKAKKQKKAKNSKVQSFVAAVVNGKNVDAQEKLNDILKEKVAQRMSKTLKG